MQLVSVETQWVAKQKNVEQREITLLQGDGHRLSAFGSVR